VELRDVEHVRLAHAVSRERSVLAALALLCALRLVAGAVLPLSADEAYYWLWSRHLAAGYFDHPPVIAWAIKAGTLLFGQTAFGVRIAGILLSFAATWFVWQSAILLTGDRKAGGMAALLFNLTLMTTVETLAATPDAPQVFAAAAFLWTLAQVVATGNGRWWLAVGAAGGIGLLSKYSTLFLGVGTLVFLAAVPSQRRWLKAPWPYLGAMLALLLFAPNLAWNAQHGWATIAFQGGRVAGHQLTLKYLGEFVGAQALLASPFILLLGVAGLAAAGFKNERRALIAALMWPSLAYFAIHALHDRVQGNWPCYLYPVLAIAAVGAARHTDWTAWRKPLIVWSAKLAVPVAAVLLIAGYAQALIGVVPLGRKDPLARLLAIGMPEVVTQIGALKTVNGADILLTTDYASTAWLSFYSSYPVASLGENYRWPEARPLVAADFAKPALYITEDRRDQHGLVSQAFADVTEIARFDRVRQGIPIAHYVVYRVRGPRSGDLGRMP
jgi:4-amino-4-deoxy-L-arabinose transferase-like glycosyltransferase